MTSFAILKIFDVPVKEDDELEGYETTDYENTEEIYWNLAENNELYCVQFVNYKWKTGTISNL